MASMADGGPAESLDSSTRKGYFFFVVVLMPDFFTGFSISFL